MKRASQMRGSAAPERNALRSRGCPNPDRALVRRRQGQVTAPRKANITTVAPLGFRIETTRRQWMAQVAKVRSLKAEGKDFQLEAQRARELRAVLVALDPSMAVESRELTLAQASESNRVKAA